MLPPLLVGASNHVIPDLVEIAEIQHGQPEPSGLTSLHRHLGEQWLITEMIGVDQRCSCLITVVHRWFQQRVAGSGFERHQRPVPAGLDLKTEDMVILSIERDGQRLTG